MSERARKDTKATKGSKIKDLPPSKSTATKVKGGSSSWGATNDGSRAGLEANHNEILLVDGRSSR